MFYNDHDPPDFHVRYQSYSARIRIIDGNIIDGRPPPIVRLTEECAALRRSALMRNWEAARTDNALERIAGLDDD